MHDKLRKAKLRQNGFIEDIDFRHPRGLDKAQLLRLADCQWVKEHNKKAGVGFFRPETFFTR